MGHHDAEDFVAYAVASPSKWMVMGGCSQYAGRNDGANADGTWEYYSQLGALVALERWRNTYGLCPSDLYDRSPVDVSLSTSDPCFQNPGCSCLSPLLLMLISFIRRNHNAK